MSEIGTDDLAKDDVDGWRARLDEANSLVRTAEETKRLVENARDRIFRKLEEAQRLKNAAIPVDRTAVTLTDGKPVPEDGSHRADRGDGQQKGYIVLSDSERAKGFVRPVRTAYQHVGRKICGRARKHLYHWDICTLSPGHGDACVFEIPGKIGSDHYELAFKSQLFGGCGQTTTMSRALAETYARDPGFYSGTMCVTCGDHFPVGADGEFVWAGTQERVGT